MQAVDFGTFFRYWLRVGCISFGGPAGQIALLHKELVDERKWISEQRFLHALNYCMLLPGPEAQQLATYIGWLMHRTWGGIVAGTLFILPSFFVLIALSWMYVAYGHLPVVAGFMYGVKPAVTALVLFAAWRMGRRTLTNAWLGLIAVLAFVSLLLGLPFPAIVLGAALLGAIGGKLTPTLFALDGTHGHGPLATTRSHAPASRKNLALLALAGMALWLVPMVILAAVYGWGSMLTQMGWFFTKAALLTFGGAYAVLPYVYQGAVEHYHWLTPLQMMDGLALGETTPGPLIMIVTYVGFIGGWSQPVAGMISPMLTGVTAACVVTYFTFLPSFIFILLGAPLIEATHGNLSITAPMTAITAAVVGVIVNLAWFFGSHVIWPAGLHAAWDPAAIAIGIGAGWALFRAGVGTVPVIAICGIAGLAFRMMFSA